MDTSTFAGQIVPSVSIDNLVNQRDAVMARLHQAMGLIWEAERIARMAHIGFPQLEQKIRGISRSVLESRRYAHHHAIVDSAEEESRVDEELVMARLTKAVDAGAWQYLMHESGLRTFMDFETRREWDRKVHEYEIPQLDVNTIRATFEGMWLNRGGMLEDGVIKCFKRLSWCYKTNQPFHFGSRIVLRGFGEYNHRRCEELDDLVRVFHVLDGKPEPDHRVGIYRAVGEAYRASKLWPKICDTEYLHIKLFKNSNAHIRFKRCDIVERMNEMLTRRFPGALPWDRHVD